MGKRRELTDEQIAEMIAAYDAGATMHDLRERYRIRYQRVRDILRSAGRTSHPGGRPAAVDEDTMIHIAERVLRGEPKTRLASEYGVHRMTITSYDRRGREILKQRMEEAA